MPQNRENLGRETKKAANIKFMVVFLFTVNKLMVVEKVVIVSSKPKLLVLPQIVGETYSRGDI